MPDPRAGKVPAPTRTTAGKVPAPTRTTRPGKFLLQPGQRGPGKFLLHAGLTGPGKFLLHAGLEALVVSGVGHWVQQEAPRETTELLLRSIRE